ncbi:unnamed protein product, partial [Protopolystoma xenopodis]
MLLFSILIYHSFVVLISSTHTQPFLKSRGVIGGNTLATAAICPSSALTPKSVSSLSSSSTTTEASRIGVRRSVSFISPSNRSLEGVSCSTISTLSSLLPASVRNRPVVVGDLLTRGNLPSALRNMSGPTTSSFPPLSPDPLTCPSDPIGLRTTGPCRFNSCELDDPDCRKQATVSESSVVLDQTRDASHLPVSKSANSIASLLSS